MTAHRLVLLRHAKSDWPPGVPDLERPLGSRGRRDAPVAGAWIAGYVEDVDLVLVSPAARTQETWALARGAWQEPPEARTEKRLYDAYPEDMLDLVRATEESVRSLVLVAHNPGTEDLAGMLSGEADPVAHEAMSLKYPTAGIAVLELDGPWSSVRPGTTRLVAFEVPRG